MSLIRGLLKGILGLIGAIVGGAGIAIATIGLELQGWSLVATIVFGALLGSSGMIQLFFGSGSEGSAVIGVIDTERVASTLLVLKGSSPNGYRVATIRQSGNEDRVELAPDAASASKFMTSTFRRKQLSRVRVWKNSEELADVRAPFYHGKGTREGRIIGGVTIRRL